MGLGMTRRWVLVGALALVYAICYSAIKAGLEFAPALRYAGYRTVAGGGTLLAYLVALGRGPAIPPRSMWPAVAAMAGLGTVILYGAMFLSPGVTGAGISSVLGNTGPLFAVVLAAPVLRERLTRRKVAALAAGVGGAALVAYPAVTDPAAPGLLAALLPLTAAGAAAGSAVLLKWLRVGDALLPFVAWQLLLGGVALLGLSATIEANRTVTWTPRFAGYLAFLALAGTAFATTAWYWLVQREDVGRLSIVLMVLVPVMGLGLARLLFAEPIDPLSALGAALALVGVGVAASNKTTVKRLPGKGAIQWE